METRHAQDTADTNQYLTVVESYLETGVPRLEAYREPLYQWLIFAAVRPVFNPGAGFSPDDRQKVIAIVATAQVALFWLLVSLLGYCVWRQAGCFALACLLLLVAADNYEYQWLPTIMSEAPTKLSFLLGTLFLITYSASGGIAKADAGALLIGLCPLFRGPDLAIAAVLAIGASVAVFFAYRGRRLLLGLAVASLFLAPTIFHIGVMGWTTGFYGLSPISAWLLAGRVLSITDPDQLIRAGVDREQVDAIARKVYVGPPERTAELVPETNDGGEPDGLMRRVYPLNYRGALEGASDYQARRDKDANRFISSEILRRLGSAAFHAVPGPMAAMTMDLWKQHATIPFLRNLNDRSVRNKVRLVSYLSVLIAVGYFAWTFRGGHPAAAWGWLAASVLFLPCYTLLSAIGQNYQTKYGNHPYLYLGLMAFFSVHVSWVGRRHA